MSSSPAADEKNVDIERKVSLLRPNCRHWVSKEAMRTLRCGDIFCMYKVKGDFDLLRSMRYIFFRPLPEYINAFRV